METDSTEKYGLDLHCTMILDEYREMLPTFELMKTVVLDMLRKELSDRGIFVTAVDARIKTEASLAGKLELKGAKYRTLSDITDILGARIITFYTDDVDKISSLAEKLFDIDWENSVDKRKILDLNSFGYLSLHYICRIPKTLFFDADHPELNDWPFELQMRTTLQHMWANMYHDTGYKSGVEVPREHLRNLSRLAGMLELADDEFSRIRTSINDYRRKVQNLVADGNFEEVPLNGDTFKSYLELKPFDSLNKRIAAINQAEIHQASMLSYLQVFKFLGLNTLGDLDRLIKEEDGDAYKYAVYELGQTDLDIISSTVALQYLCLVRILKSGGGEKDLASFFEIVNGKSSHNEARARFVIQSASNLPFMKNK
ncbi:MAG: hypothetical protein IJU27_01005 [Bacteroidales bacterium]|nr:hypothetical protein [Bacteroidales bacterium]